jgi:Mn-containing catalase
MDTDNGLLIVIGVVALVVLFNIGLALSFLRNRSTRQIIMFQDTLKKITNPWKEEDEALSELRDMVSNLETDEDHKGLHNEF